MRKIDVTGSRFGRWTVLRRVCGANPTKWRCVCDCGTEKDVLYQNLRRGLSVSCGCYRSDWTSEAKTTHGLRGTPEYSVWSKMRQRCEDPGDRAYSRYGGRGIYVSPEWTDYGRFYDDMGPRPTPEHSIDRIDNDGPYCAENCRWATRQEQANNKRSNRLLTVAGETLTMAQAVGRYGVPYSALQARLNAGWSDEDAVFRPKREMTSEARRGRRLVVGGVDMTVAEASKIYGISYGALSHRLDAGWDPDEAVSLPSIRAPKRG